MRHAFGRAGERYAACECAACVRESLERHTLPLPLPLPLPLTLTPSPRSRCPCAGEGPSSFFYLARGREACVGKRHAAFGNAELRSERSAEWQLRAINSWLSGV
jgi:hypothetical protein